MADGYFFKYFPTIPYDSFDDSLQHKVVTDIFRRVRSTLEARQDRSVYYKYDVKDTETPDIVSYKYYGEAQYYWVILLMNQLRDPQWGWPINQRSFERYINKKYGSVPIATQTNSHYETIEQKAITTDDNYTAGDVVLQGGLKVDSDFSYQYTPINSGVPGTPQTFLAADVVKEITMWDKEIVDNENKRNIVLLRRNLLGEFVNEFENLITTRR